MITIFSQDKNQLIKNSKKFIATIRVTISGAREAIVSSGFTASLLLVFLDYLDTYFNIGGNILGIGFQLGNARTNESCHFTTQ
mmetsp:Transcript_4682/g.10020  ORF Transcript_4682/g.10020 Transcript_4682/m.10020 type:complete len:83 (-) Transcript_4682:826-1074(-)